MAQDRFHFNFRLLLLFSLIPFCLFACAPTYMPPTTASLPAPEKIMITDIGKEKEEEKTTLIFYSTQMLNYTSFAQLDPPAVIMDIPDVYLHNNLKPITFSKGPIKKVIPEQISSGESVQTRLTIQMEKAFPYEIKREKNQLRVGIKHYTPFLNPAVATLLSETSQVPDEEELPARKKDLPGEKEISASAPIEMMASAEPSAIPKLVMPEREILRSVIPSEKDKDEKPEPEKKAFIASISESLVEKVDKEQPPEQAEDEIDLLMGKKYYKGQPISLDFQNADIRSVLRIIADVSEHNLVIDPEVKGKVDITLIKPVPWDQALDVILKTNKLDMKMEGNIIRVSLPQTFAAEKKAELAAIQAVREAKEEATKTIPLTTRIVSINYAKAEVLKSKLEPMLSTSDKLAEKPSIMVDERTNTLIIKDLPEVLEEILSVIKTLDRPTPQVMIEARIVETNKNYIKDLGIQWGGTYSKTTNYRFANTIDVTGTTGTDQYAVNLPISSAAFGAIGISLGHINGESTLDIQLKAMEQSGKGKIVSNPRIATLDNEQATIKSGHSIPYQTTDAEGNPSTSFVDAAINLTVTPQITPDNNITMRIEANKSEPDWSNTVAGAPSIITRQATTRLIVANGDTAVIGGLAQQNEGSNLRKVPIFGDIPILGYLFRTKDNTDSFDELLIFITPRILESEDMGNETL